MLGGASATRYVTLIGVGLVSFFVRLFAVIRFESVIHEFDPYFNIRTTHFLSQEGYMEFWNWFDESSWYPLGRVIGQTLFPGLMTTGYVLWSGLNSLGLPINVTDVCVFIAPIFSAFAAWSAYGLCVETTGDHLAGLVAALFMGVCPSYLSRSTAGAFDNEAIAIFTLIFSFYTFVRAMNRGTTLSILLAVLGYFYMVAAWGGYVFVTNTVAIYTLYLLFMKKFNDRHFVVYSVWHILGTIWCFNIPFVGFAAFKSSEHMSAHGTFLVLCCWKLRMALIERVPTSQSLKKIMNGFTLFMFVAFQALFLVLLRKGWTKWSGRSMTLLDPTYAAKHVPIIASVSEHQPTIWNAFHFQLGSSFTLIAPGLWLTLTSAKESAWFLPVFCVLAGHFAGVMVRLMLVLAPAAACLAGVTISHLLRVSMKRLAALAKHAHETQPPFNSRSKSLGAIGVGIVSYLMYLMVVQGVWSSANSFSSPSIVTSVPLSDDTRLIMDDFREAFSWFRDNTHPNARLLSWWDYGYQACKMANRTVIVDNNTWNNTHIATVGLAFASDEDTAYPVIAHLDVDYVFVVFGGASRYSGDDLNKFMWMIRIGSGVFPFMPHEQDFISSVGYDMGDRATKTLKNSLMYRMSYHNFHNNSLTNGYDILRQTHISKLPPLKYFTEAYTTSNWIVRIYQVNRPQERLPFGRRSLRNVLMDPPGPIYGG